MYYLGMCAAKFVKICVTFSLFQNAKIGNCSRFSPNNDNNGKFFLRSKESLKLRHFQSFWKLPQLIHRFSFFVVAWFHIGKSDTFRCAHTNALILRSHQPLINWKELITTHRAFGKVKTNNIIIFEIDMYASATVPKQNWSSIESKQNSGNEQVSKKIDSIENQIVI